MRRLLAPLLGTLLAAGCNMLTGADDIALGTGGAAAATGPGATSASASQSTGVGGGSASSGATGMTTTNTATTGPGAGGGATTVTGGGGMVQPDCGGPCGANEHCETSTMQCVCDPGFVSQGGACTAAPVGDPTTHTEMEVCQAWNDGHVITTPNPVNASGADCDAGSLAQGGITDTLARINMFRWLSGLGPTTDDAGYNADAQLCANLEAWWTFPSGISAHDPPSNSKCYTAAGATSAGQSNIAWGSGHPADAIDQFMDDSGNETTMGHRRWIVNPPLGPVGIGYWETGGIYGNAECLRVFGTQGGGPNPPWTSVPNAGFVPIQITKWVWTFHGSLSGISTATISMLRVDDNTPLPVNVQTLQQGFAQAAISWTPSGWTTEAGMTYRVTVGGLGGGDVVYDVKPVSCN